MLVYARTFPRDFYNRAFRRVIVVTLPDVQLLYGVFSPHSKVRRVPRGIRVLSQSPSIARLGWPGRVSRVTAYRRDKSLSR